MIKDITVYLDGSSFDDIRMRNAVSLCERFKAHLTGLFLNLLPESIVGGGYVAGPVILSAELRDEAIKFGDDRGSALAERLAAQTSLSEFRRYDVVAADVSETIATQARSGDLMVMSCPYGDVAGGIDPEIVEATLFESGRGILVVPTAGEVATEFKRVLVGWKDTREASRAIAEAMPFLTAADEVVLVIVDEDGAPAEEGLEPASDVARHLERHAVPVEVRHLSKWNRTADGLLNEARAIGADLIVAGAYGHSRIREWALGGTTRDLLKSNEFPVLMAH